MQTQDKQAEQTEKPDPAQVALDAINDFDRHMAESPNDADEWALAQRANLRVQWAQIAELRRHTNLLTSILCKLNAVEYNTRGES